MKTRTRSSYDHRGYSRDRKPLPKLPEQTPEHIEAFRFVTSWLQTWHPSLLKSLGTRQAVSDWWMGEWSGCPTFEDMKEHLEHFWICPHCAGIAYIDDLLHTPPKFCPACERDIYG